MMMVIGYVELGDSLFAWETVNNKLLDLCRIMSSIFVQYIFRNLRLESDVIV